MGLPGYAGKKGQEEEDQDCCPEWYGDGDGKYKDRRSGHQYRQGSAEGVNGSRGSHRCRKWMGQKNEKDIPSQPSQKEHRQEASLSDRSDEETSQEVKTYHIEQYVSEATVDKHAAYDGPGLS